MKTATLHDLQEQSGLITHWTETGESIEITREGKPFATITPILEATPSGEQPKGQVEWPDFIARMKEYMPEPLPPGTIQSVIDYDRGDR